MLQLNATTPYIDPDLARGLAPATFAPAFTGTPSPLTSCLPAFAPAHILAASLSLEIVCQSIYNECILEVDLVARMRNGKVSTRCGNCCAGRLDTAFARMELANAPRAADTAACKAMTQLQFYGA